MGGAAGGGAEHDQFTYVGEGEEAGHAAVFEDGEGTAIFLAHEFEGAFEGGINIDWAAGFEGDLADGLAGIFGESAGDIMAAASSALSSPPASGAPAPPGLLPRSAK